LFIKYKKLILIVFRTMQALCI